MKIRVVPRAKVEMWANQNEAQLVDHFNVVSIITNDGTEVYPIKGEYPGVLRLKFNDDGQDFSKEHADQIIDWLKTIDLTKPMLIHCTLGVSRSGAVGDAFNAYYNQFLENHEDAIYFEEVNRRTIIPNVRVKSILMTALLHAHKRETK